MLRWLILLVSLMWPWWALAQRPPAVVPTGVDTVLERLPKGYAALVPQQALTTASARLVQVERLLTTAARTGDARLATRAEALLARFPAGDTTSAVLRARAFTAQHRHDFDAAVGLLDTLIESHPRDADARFSRAQILLVQGHLDRSRRDCTVLAFGVDAGRGSLCVAALSLRTGDTKAAARLADRWLAQSDDRDESRRYVLVMRAEVASRTNAGHAGVEHAELWFKRALALAPDDVRTLAAYARHLRGEGRPAQVLQLLAAAPDTDGLHLERTLAAHAIGDPAARAMIAAQARRYGLAQAVGSEPELRDEAEFALTLQADPDRALALALRNFATQRDAEDVDLLRRAAAAANRPQALQSMQAWAESQRLELPRRPRDDS